MKTRPISLATCALFLIAPLAAHAQATEGAQASATPTVPSLNAAPEADELSYTLGASESVLWGYNGYSGLTNTSNVNGTASYVSGNQSHPVSFLYSGGYLFGSGGQPSGSYQNLGISQQILTRHFGFTVGDTVSYLPNAPVFGLSGVVGVGDIGTSPLGTGGLPIDSILTNYGRRVTNTVSGSANTKFSQSTSLNAFGAYTIQRFIDDTGIENNELDLGGSMNHRIDARNSIGAGYVYSRFTYLQNTLFGFNLDNLRIDSHEANLQFEHVFTRRLVFNASAGPQWTQSSRPTPDAFSAIAIPSRLDFAANVSLSYMARNTEYVASYSRGTSTGGGVLIGTVSDNVNFTVDRKFGHDWTGGFSVNYGHADSLVTDNLGHTKVTGLYTGVQVTRKLGRFFNAYGSYNLEHQSLTGPLVGFNAFGGTANAVGFGINYTPRPIHMRHK